MKLLVAGAAGFIGSAYARVALERRPEVELVALDKLTYAGRRENLADLEGRRGFRFVQGDITDTAAVRDTLPGCE